MHPMALKQKKRFRGFRLIAGSFSLIKVVKAIVMACNTATSAAVRLMRAEYNIPVISIEPAVKPAIETSYNGDIIVLATEGTITQPRYNLLLERLGAKDRVINVPCKGLVTLIEDGDLNAGELDEYIRCIFAPFHSDPVDTVVLGCTHYSFIKDKIKAFLYENFRGKRQVIDGNQGTVKQLKRVLEEQHLLNPSLKKGNVSFYSSGGSKYIKMMKRLFKMEV